MRYTIDIDPALHERYMLKIVLQPLVENAIYHGIKRRRGRGQITVTGRRQAGGMYFAVEDNGMGMTPERLAEVRASLQNGAPLDPDGKGGYGLRNVEQRLRLYYGCGLTIRVNTGTAHASASPYRTNRRGKRYDACIYCG